MTQPIAYLSFSVDVDCPECKETFDLAEDDDEHAVARAIFSNNWDSLQGYEATCKLCQHEFTFEKVEY